MQVKPHRHLRWWIALVVTGLMSTALTGELGAGAPTYRPEGEMSYALYVTISPACIGVHLSERPRSSRPAAP